MKKTATRLQRAGSAVGRAQKRAIQKKYLSPQAPPAKSKETDTDSDDVFEPQDSEPLSALHSPTRTSKRIASRPGSGKSGVSSLPGHSASGIPNQDNAEDDDTYDDSDDDEDAPSNHDDDEDDDEVADVNHSGEALLCGDVAGAFLFFFFGLDNFLIVLFLGW